MSTTLARKIRRITQQKLWETVPDTMTVELVTVTLSAQQRAENERAIRASWKIARLAR
jgi:hypothetical protein